MGDVSHITFRVRACSDVHICLSPNVGEHVPELTYEVVIGGWYNTRSVIRTENIEKAIADTPEIISCTEMRHFWIRWTNGHIEVGSGEIIGDHLFMFWTDDSPLNIHAVSLATGYGHAGEYEVSQNTG